MNDGHLIAPICGTCGGEIEKVREQWLHVSRLTRAEALRRDNSRVVRFG